MAQEFKIGDVVRLKSGGPAMTVTGSYPHEHNNVKQYYCSWFTSDTAAEVSKEHFAAPALELTNEILVEMGMSDDGNYRRGEDDVSHLLEPDPDDEEYDHHIDDPLIPRP
ncbi:YodC family protein [Dongshaea marina]|uniref:YodC family protein n=1 Tax=Dongshaea marina TaxID=2047966 RepID=UPI000D3EA039|nr:DUF2158 domain-containing protein [Dongshaea marina]